MGMAKLLLVQYNIIHSALALQFKMFTIACSKKALGGEIAILVSDKMFVAKIYTDFLYIKKIVKNKTNEKEVVYKLKKQKKSERERILKSKKYKKIVNEIISNLSKWLPYFSWDNQTKLKIYVDDIERYNNLFDEGSNVK